MSRATIFDAVKQLVPNVWNDPGHIHAMDNLLDAFGVPRDDEIVVTANKGSATSLKPGSECIALIKRFEGCGKLRDDGMLEAYPDPGTGGAPWTIGWGATGPGINKGTVWTQAQADARLVDDIDRHAHDVASALGKAKTSQAQFDALVSFHYNTGSIKRATLTKKHVAGDFEGAAREFARWNRSGGRVLRGLVARREAEAELYRKGS